METIVRSAGGTEVIISPTHPFVLIGERINPDGGLRKEITRALAEKDADFLIFEGQSQIDQGANILDVNAQAEEISDEPETLAWAVENLTANVDAPLAIDTNNFDALKAALEVSQGKVIINSVTGSESSLEKVLPLVVNNKTALIGLTMDEQGIPEDARSRLEIARTILDRAAVFGIKAEDIIIDPLTISVGVDHLASQVTTQAMRLIREELGLNLTTGLTNISFGLPHRALINDVYLSIAIANGLNSAIVDPQITRSLLLTADLLMGKDEYAAQFLKDYRNSLR